MSEPCDAARRSVELLSERMASIPDGLRVAAEVPLPVLSRPPRTVVTTGIGASEGPARLLASVLAEAGLAARFVAFSGFSLTPPRAELLIVFSQNLSPNARLALRVADRFGACWLVTSVGHSPGASTREPLLRALVQRGVVPIVVPPAYEDGMLVRVIGPAVATLIALRLADAITGVTRMQFDARHAADAYAACWTRQVQRAQDQDADPSLPMVLVGAGVAVDWLHGHRWKLLETLLREDPPLWDVLQVAHGPLQAAHGKALRWVVFGVPGAQPLVERLERALRGTQHTVVPWIAGREDALSCIEHTAWVDAWLLQTLRAHPTNLLDWPGRHADAPLYDLGEDAL